MNTADKIMALADEYADAYGAWTETRVKRREALRAEIEALVRDAERYLWLRRGGYSIQFAQSVLNDTPFGIDAAIDAAMKEKQS